mgnify:CR=1 FL=1
MVMRNKKGQYTKGAKGKARKPKARKAKKTHRMPDGRVMSGLKHSSKSKLVLGEKEKPSPYKGRAKAKSNGYY